MSWRDRDYARWTPEERRRFLGPGPASRESRAGVSRRIGTTQGVALAAGVSAVLFALGHFPAGHPVVPVLHFTLPSSNVRGSASPLVGSAAAPARVILRGPSTTRVGAFLTFHGPVPIGDNGQVVIEGSLNGGAWRTLTVADGSGGNYLARIALNQRGTLRLRVVFRDGTEAVQTIRVL
ncbi:MAG: hypothetical protein ACRDM1_06780 [Gaiellaceae bacterium]